MGFNVVTLTNCCAAMSIEAHQAAVEEAFGMFSMPMVSSAFLSAVAASPPGINRHPKKGTPSNQRTFAPQDAKGGRALLADSTAIVMIEFQREFTDVGGKLHGAVSEVMASTCMLANAAKVCEGARLKGCKIIHVPISFSKDKADNPNRGLGILKGCADGDLFLAGTWNVEFNDMMAPQAGDLVVTGKKGLDAFPGTNLENLLMENGIETVVVGGFLTNCCVESTIRTACEKGFNVVTLTGCCAATSAGGHKAAVEGTFGMFSVPMASAALLDAIGN